MSDSSPDFGPSVTPATGAASAMGLSRPSGFDANVWAVKHGIALAPDAEGHQLPVDKHGNVIPNAPGFQYPSRSRDAVIDPPAWQANAQDGADIPQVHGAPTAPQIRPPGAPQSGGGSRDAVKEAMRQEWLAAGYPPAAVEGILRNPQQESGFDPYILGDYKDGKPTSIGGYQHHADRAQRLVQYLEGERAKGANLRDPVTMARAQTRFSIQEMAGGDAVAAKARETLMHETDPNSAYSIFRRAFERPANGPVPMSMVAHGLPPAEKALLEQFSAAGARERDQIVQDKNDLMRMALAEPPGSAKRQKLEDEMHQQIAKREAEWEEKWKNPPVMKPVDALENFGSVGTIVALIGGLFARRHMTAALGAAGQAMQAINQNNYDKYQQSMKVWELQTRSAMETIKMQREDLQSILHDDDKAWDHKMALLAIKQKEYGMDRDYAASERGDIQTTLNTMMTLDKSGKQLENLIKVNAFNNHEMFVNNERAKYYAEHQDMVGQPLPADVEMGIQQRADQSFPLPGVPQQRSASSATPANIVVHDKDGKEVFRGAAQKSKTGPGYVGPDGKEIGIPEGGNVTIVGRSGERLQPQVQRLLGAGSQMEAHLGNLAEMPIDASIGPFMGIESKTPDGLADALRRTAVRKVATGDASQAMQVEFIGVSRQIAALDSQGAAQGLVGLSHQAEGYAPLPTDSPLTVMRKYASLRQVVEQSMKAILTSGTANEDQKKGAKEILDNVQRSIPFTVHDINTLQFPPGGDIDKSARAVAERILAKGGGTSAPPAEAVSELKAHKDDPVYRQSFDKHFGAGAAAKALGE